MSFLDISTFFTIISLLTLINGDYRCPNPDEQQDFADKNKTISRPPANFTYFNATFIDAFSAEVNWSRPFIYFSKDPTIQICHFNLKISYKTEQKGSLVRYTHMNIDPTQLTAHINHLTPNTDISISLSACLLLSKQPGEHEYVCSISEVLRFTTENNTCHLGYYNIVHTNGSDCTECLCNNKSRICEDKTGVCLDCLHNSHGNRCEYCLDGYQLNDDGVCEGREDETDLLTDTTTPLPNIEVASSTEKTSINSNTTNLVLVDTSPSTASTNQSNPSTVTNSQSSTSTVTNNQSNTSVITVSTSPTITHEHQHHPNHSYDSTTMHENHRVKSVTLVIAVCSVIALLLTILVIVIIYRRYKSGRKIPVHFWTMQLQNNSNNTSVAFSDIVDPHDVREDNILLNNDFNSTNHVLSFATDENPYRQLTAQT